MSAKKDPALELAQALLLVLARQRDQGAGYPLTLQQLVELTDPAAPTELVAKAIKKKPFTAQTLLVQPKDRASPIALVADAAALASSVLLLEYVLNTVCTAAKPTIEVDKLPAKSPKALRAAFGEALWIRVKNQQLPAGVALLRIGTKLHLHLTRFTLPPAPEEVLAGQLVQVLQQRRAGGGAYPARLSELTTAIEPPPAPALLKKALAHGVFQQNVLRAVAKDAESPIALHTDLERLADSTLLLEAVLERCRSAANHVATVAELKKKVVPALQPALETAVRLRLDADTLPATVGWILQKKKPLLFLLTDVHAKVPAPVAPAPATGPPADFRTVFDAAFEQLDGQKGGHNLVNLVDLRRLVPVERTAFDAGLHELRRAGRYTLSAAEGRHGIRPEEQDAGIREDGTLLLFVSKRPAAER